MADVIRARHPDRWLPPETGNHLIAQAYADDPAIRAAWAFALRESIGTPASMVAIACCASPRRLLNRQRMDMMWDWKLYNDGAKKAGCKIATK